MMRHRRIIGPPALCLLMLIVVYWTGAVKLV